MFVPCRIQNEIPEGAIREELAVVSSTKSRLRPAGGPGDAIARAVCPAIADEYRRCAAGKSRRGRSRCGKFARPELHRQESSPENKHWNRSSHREVVRASGLLDRLGGHRR